MNILVVDDEQDVQALFELRFRREVRAGEYSLAFCYSGEEALAYLADHHSEVVLILSDINMPGMTGFDLLKQIRTHVDRVQPAVMMITAYNDEQSREQALALGAHDYLTKPIDFAALKLKINRVL
ncbi:response regulator [Spirosoma jeollabukense]